MVIMFPGPVSMGANLGRTLLYYLVVGVFVAYLGYHSVDPADPYLSKFRICGAVAFAAHGLGWIPFQIWYRVGKFLPNFVDSLLYALLTAGVFGWLWPK